MSGVPIATWIGRELASGRYRVDALLGEGGMGAVYRAWDKNLGTEVVVKVPHAAMLQDAEFAARFAREISSLVKLSHPHIVKVSDVGEQDGLPFAVMQFLPGGSLEDRQKTGPNREARSLPSDSLKAWLPSIAEALDFVHSQGYIHRDVKPANILFDAHGNAYLSDFGITACAVTQRQTNHSKTVVEPPIVIGTPEYMSKELIGDHNYDGRADQYALAITVFEILAGCRPFEDETVMRVLVRHWTEEPPDLASLVPVPATVAEDVRKALSKLPERRFRSCESFAQAVINGFEPFPILEPVQPREIHGSVIKPSKVKIPPWLISTAFTAISFLVMQRVTFEPLSKSNPRKVSPMVTRSPSPQTDLKNSTHPKVEQQGNQQIDTAPALKDAKPPELTPKPIGTELAKEYRERGAREFDARNYEEAVRQFSFAVDLDGSELSYGSRTVARFYTGNYRDAAEDCSMVISKNSKKAAAYYLRSLCSRRLANELEAEADRARALELDPSINKRLKKLE